MLGFFAKTCALAASLVVFASRPAAAAGADLAARLDTTWMLTAAAMVFLMQLGFMLLEAGSVRTKSAVNVAQKNLLDFAFATLAFAAIGFMFAFGTSAPWAPVGFEPRLLGLSAMKSEEVAFFVFQAMFCGTAATIVAGAVAERMRLNAYVVCATFTGALVYPIFVHWAWGSALGPAPGAFLADLGFVDFAGSVVVHATGAWIALAACLALGPRAGRFAADGTPVRFSGHSPIFSAAGALILFFGWLGFNGGSTLEASEAVAHILLATVLAGTAGAAAGYAAGWSRGVLLHERPINGLLGGLVAVTAGCHLLDPAGAMIVGFLGGLVANWANQFLESRLRIDDAVGAIGVHGAAGVFGTLALALLAPVDLLPAGGRLEQLGIQALGVGLNFLLAFGLASVAFAISARMSRLRVEPSAEEVGLNFSEHGARLGTGHVEDAMASLVAGRADLAMRLPVSAGDDAQRLTELFNGLMVKLQRAELRRSEETERLRAAEEAERLAAFADAALEAIVVVREGRIADANAAAQRLFGEPLEALRGRFFTRLFVDAERPRVRNALASGGAERYETKAHVADGQTASIELRARRISFCGETAEVVALVDLRERKAAEARIVHLALHDPLTDLPNREAFNRRLAEIVERARPEQPAALLLVDLDRFKDINDLHGHPAGDAVIVATAERLRAVAQKEAFVARLAGDEFVVMQTGLVFPAQAADLAHRILQEIRQPLLLPSGQELRPCASVGIALAPEHGARAGVLVQNADVALYAAKKNGRNGYAMFEPGMGADLRRRQRLEAALSGALERGEFDLHFQPRLCVATCEIVSYEALARWPRGPEGPVSPADFIPVAEASGLIVPIGEWVLREACRAAATTLAGAAMSVNVSPRQFRDPRFVDVVRATLAEFSIEPSTLELEVTESVLIDDDKRALAVLGALKRLGVRIALDDFGTGYSSLSYLTRFSFDTIKIDRSFVHAMSTEESAMHVFQSVLSLSAGLGVRVVAEGVETQEQLAKLLERGCDEVQGFLVARPEPLAATVRTAPTHVRDFLSGAGGAILLRSTAERMREPAIVGPKQATR